MKIEKKKDKPPIISEIYNPVGIETDDGIFYIAQRDSGIEIVFNEKLIFSSTNYIRGYKLAPEVKSPLFTQANVTV